MNKILAIPLIEITPWNFAKKSHALLSPSAQRSHELPMQGFEVIPIKVEALS